MLGLEDTETALLVHTEQVQGPAWAKPEVWAENQQKNISPSVNLLSWSVPLHHPAHSFLPPEAEQPSSVLQLVPHAVPRP